MFTTLFAYLLNMRLTFRTVLSSALLFVTIEGFVTSIPLVLEVRAACGSVLSVARCACNLQTIQTCASIGGGIVAGVEEAAIRSWTVMVLVSSTANVGSERKAKDIFESLGRKVVLQFAC